MSKYNDGFETAVIIALLMAIFALGVWVGSSLEEHSTTNNWCESVHEGQMQGDFCITPENVAIPRPEWSK